MYKPVNVRCKAGSQLIAVHRFAISGLLISEADHYLIAAIHLCPLSLNSRLDIVACQRVPTPSVVWEALAKMRGGQQKC